MTLDEFAKLTRTPYAWPGGYPVAGLCDDGGILCNACMCAERSLIEESIRDNRSEGWLVVAPFVVFESDDLEPCHCDHCGTRIDA